MPTGSADYTPLDTYIHNKDGISQGPAGLRAMQQKAQDLAGMSYIYLTRLGSID